MSTMKPDARRVVTRYLQKKASVMRGYKVMRYEGDMLVSGANSRLRFPLRKGVRLRMPGRGVYLTPHKQYALDYYSGLADEEVLLTLEFDAEDILFGNLEDQEPEIAVPEAKIVDFEFLD